MQDRRVGLHGLAHVEHGRQHFVFDLDQRQRFLGDMRVGRADGCHRMTEVEHFVARQHVIALVAQVRRAAFARVDQLVGHVGKSAAVTTAFTPGSASAALVSIERMIAWACGLRSTLP